MKEYRYEEIEEFGVSMFIENLVKECEGVDKDKLPPLIAPEGYLLTKEEHKVLRDIGYDMYVPEYDGEIKLFDPSEEVELLEEDLGDGSVEPISKPEGRNTTTSAFSGGIVVVGNVGYHLNSRSGGVVGQTAGGLISQANLRVNVQQSWGRNQLFRRTDGRYMANIWIESINGINLWREQLWTVPVTVISGEAVNRTGGLVNVRQRPSSMPNGIGTSMSQAPNGTRVAVTHEASVPQRLQATGIEGPWIPHPGMWRRFAQQRWVHHTVFTM